MPSYNHEKYIAEAIESVLNQTVADLELVIVDDASADNSQDIIRRYQKLDHRIRAHYRKTNAINAIKTANATFELAQGKCIAPCDSDDLYGVDKPINTALNMARGKYITLLDSDDIFIHDKLEKQLAVIKGEGNEDKVILSDGITIDPENNILGPLFLGPFAKWSEDKKKNGDLYEELLMAGGLYFFRHTMLCQRELIADIRFDRRYLVRGEYKFALEVARRLRFHYLDDVLYMHRLHDHNMSVEIVDNRLINLRAEDAAVQEQALICKDALASHRNRLSQRALTHLCHVIIMGAMKREDLGEIRHYVLELMNIDPPLAESIQRNHTGGRRITDMNATLDADGKVRLNMQAGGTSIGAAVIALDSESDSIVMAPALKE